MALGSFSLLVRFLLLPFLVFLSYIRPVLWFSRAEGLVEFSKFR